MNMPTCPHCQSINIVKNGLTSYGKQNYGAATVGAIIANANR